MKKTILFALVALLLLAMFTGCRAYRGDMDHVPGRETVERDGTTTRGFHYRGDGYVGAGRRADGAARGRVDGVEGRHYRHDGLVTDSDGIIGNGTHADRPADGYNNARRSVDGTDGIGRVTRPAGTTAR